MTAAAGLARITVQAPARRVDVALPDHAPLAELLPELLRHAGEDLADEGQAHGGWQLRRIDGTTLAVGAALAPQGVRDGDVLHLVPARADWPELEYDDVAEAIAAGARRYGRAWDGTATRTVALGLAAVVLLYGLATVIRAGSGVVALAGAAVLLAGGVLAARSYGDGVAGATLAGYALPTATVAGSLALPGAVPAARLLVAASALVLASALGAAGIGYAPRLFLGGLVAGLLGAAGALLGYWLPPAGAAAIVVAALVPGIALIPLLAIRLGRLPMPVPSTPGAVDTEPPGRVRVYAAVARTDEVLTGALCGVAVAMAGGALVLVSAGGMSGRVLVGVAAGALALRGRQFPAVRHRLPLLLAGAAGYLILVGWLLRAGHPRDLAATGAALLLVVLVIVGTGSVYRRHPPGPYLGRAADLLDAVGVVSAIPVACAVLGLYGAVRDLLG